MPSRLTGNKSFWAIAALASLFLLAFSAWSLYGRITLYFNEDVVSVSPKPVPLPPDQPEEEPGTLDLRADADGSRDVSRAPEKPAAEEKQKAIKIVFEFRSGSAKAVTMAGSFTKWHEVKMSKKGGAWKTEVYILPGNYLFHFVADGKKTLDPDKPRSPLGESVLMVAPKRS